MAKWIGAVVMLAVLGSALWLGRTVRVGVVLSDSMRPTLQRADAYLIRIDAYRHKAPARGDIVVIRNETDGTSLVKRVIGVGGDQVGVALGRVWLNGRLLAEPYIKKRRGVIERPVLTRVADGHLFLLGDNRDFSEDSRDLGTLSVANVMGRVEAVIYPLNRRGRLPGPESQRKPQSGAASGQVAGSSSTAPAKASQAHEAAS